MDIGFHLTGMGDYGVLQLVFCVVEWNGAVEIHTGAVRIDSISHGGVYSSVDFSQSTRPELRRPLEGENDAASEGNSGVPFLSIEVDAELINYHNHPFMPTVNDVVSIAILAPSSLVAPLQNDKSEEFRGVEMV